MWVDDWHFTAAGQPRPLRDWLHRGNEVLIRELLGAIEANRTPSASGRDAHLATEMIQGVYASHLAGGQRLALPLTNRDHPLIA